ncbi:hypothetical protein BsIDN1_64510 [Bacillus safensis]|uniref:CobW C-terminal domain-containing protein n=1 Tax=Bacillus safensis TaxID=561879 RepID=A0A5S9MIA3_BACIA|nr:hypothetical protein BsIDN1_64510 [Bacillus safensis]
MTTSEKFPIYSLIKLNFCDVLIINKCDLVSPSELDRLEHVLNKLQPEASIIRTSKGIVQPDDILNTGLFDFEKSSASAGWIKEINAGHVQHTPETEEYQISSFVYERRLPFHTGRLNAWLDQMPEQIVRAKGFTWLATHHDLTILISQAGKSVAIEPIAYWIAALPEQKKHGY